MRKPGPRELQQLARAHAVTKWLSGLWGPGLPESTVGLLGSRDTQMLQDRPTGQLHQKQRCCSASSLRARAGWLPSWAHKLPPPSGERLLLPSLVNLMNQQELARETPAPNQGCWLDHPSHGRKGWWLDHPSHGQKRWWLDHLTNALAWAMHLSSQRHSLQRGASAALTTLPAPSPTQPHPHQGCTHQPKDDSSFSTASPG